MGFPRQEYWSGLSFPSPGNLPNPGKEPISPALTGGFFTAEPPGELARFYQTLGPHPQLSVCYQSIYYPFDT